MQVISLLASELLRNPCLQFNAKTCLLIYLPVFPIDSPKDKTRRSSLPGKFAKERDSSLDNLYPFWTNAKTGPSSSSQAASSTNGTEEKLETKKELIQAAPH